MAGHKNLKKIEAEMRLSLTSSRPISMSLSLNVAKHSLSSLETKIKILIEEDAFTSKQKNKCSREYEPTLESNCERTKS